ncbi:hypothetical protein ID866_9460, partial [Astraeus odoratus]
MATISGSAAGALQSVSLSDICLFQALPKAELHAHLNYPIPSQTILELFKSFPLSADTNHEMASTIDGLRTGLVLGDISEAFPLFHAIYALTSTPSALSRATRDVLDAFLKSNGGPPSGFTYTPAPECTYIEIRSTPRMTAAMTWYTYLMTVLDEIEKYAPDPAALIVSIDRQMAETDAAECIDLAIALKAEGRRLVGLDLCGDPHKGDIATFEKHFRRGKEAGLGVTLHIAETKDNTVAESLALLDWRPDRLGHATFLLDEHKALFFADVPQAGVDDSLNVQIWDPVYPLHGIYTTAYRKHIERIRAETTEPEAARQMLSYHVNADKHARRASLKDRRVGQAERCIQA